MNKNKKLLILVNDLSFFISHRLMVAKASIDKGFDVVIGYGELGGANKNLVIQNGIRITHVPMHRGGLNIFNDFKLLIRIWKCFKEEKPDIVHLVTIKPYLYGGVISRLAGVPAVVSAVSGLGTIFIGKELRYKILRLFLYPFYKIAFNHFNQKVIIQNKDDLKTLVEWGVLKINKVKLLRGSGVKIADFSNLDEPEGTPIVCFAARFLRDKGINEFILAARLLHKKGIKARFCLAGEPDLNNPTSLSIDEVNKLKKDKSIEVLGYQNDISNLYAKSHIICLPSYREGLPKSLVEAAAASRAVVTTDVPGCREVIIPNKTGLLVPIKDPVKLADALEWLINHPQERVDMGKAGRILAENEFTIEKIVQNHIEIYDELLN